MPALPVLAILLAAGQAGILPTAGRVIDRRTGAAVAGATVAVVGMTSPARTDASGRFEWTVPPAAPAVVVVTLRDGRVMKPLHVWTDPGGALTIAVEPAVAETMTVSAVSESIDVPPGTSATFLGRDDIALRRPATLVQVLENVPGVWFVAEGQAAVPAIRGQARGRTLILVDGVRAGSERRAGANASFVDPGVLRSVEIARGPGSVAYGSDAIGGVIAARTRDPERTPGWHGRFAGAIGGGVPERRGEAEVSRGHGSGGVLIGLRWREFDDYESPRGRIADSGWRDAGVRLAWEEDTGAGRLQVRWQSDLGRDLGRPRSDSDITRVTSPVEDAHRLTMSLERATAGPFRRLRLDALVSLERQQIDQDRLAAGTRPRSLESSETSFRDAHVRATGERAAGLTRIRAGLDLVGRYGLRTIDTVTSFNGAGIETSRMETISVDAAHRTNVAAFLEGARPLGARWQASAGARVDLVRSHNRGGFWGDRSSVHAAVSGVASMSATVREGLAVTAQVARGFRDATLSERFYRGPVGRGIVEGNPDLAPETSLQVDLTMRATHGRVQASVSGYRYHVSDLIERYAVNATSFRIRNRGAARFTGVEAAAAIDVGAGATIGISAQASRGRDGGNGAPLDDVAPVAVAIDVRYSPGGRVTAYARAAAYRRHDAAGPSEVPTPGHAIVDAGASWRLSDRVTVQAIGRNLLDAEHYASAGPRWVYAPGRQTSLAFVVSF